MRIRRIFISGMLFAVPVIAGPELPPHIYDIEKYSCTVIDKPIIVVDSKYPNNKPIERDIYESHARAQYFANRYLEYRKTLGIYETMPPAVEDCVNWYIAVKKAKARK